MRSILLGIAAWVFLSCSGRPTGPGDLPGVQGSWELQAYEVAGDSRRAIAEPGLYTADFTADSRVSARADCNRCSSSYSTAGAGLEIGALACTRAYCGDESFSDDYVAALDEAASFERSASSLVIRHPRGSLRFVPR